MHAGTLFPPVAVQSLPLVVQHYVALQTSRQLKGLEHPVDRDRLTSGATRTASSSLQGVHTFKSGNMEMITTTL